MSSFQGRPPVFVCFYFCLRVLLAEHTHAAGTEARDLGVETLSLNGKWMLRNSNGSVSLVAEVPGCIHTALLKQNLIQDPYYRFNDLAYRWISLDNWTYSSSFSVPAHIRESQRVVLVFEGVDTVSIISLNGVIVGRTDNMFRRYDVEVGGLLKDHGNVVEVSLVSAVTYASQRSDAHTAYKVPPLCPPAVQKGECHVNFIRKAQSSFSWDWGPSFPTQGLWRGVHLEAFTILRLQTLSTTPTYDSNLSRWSVGVDLFFDVAMVSEGRVLLSLPELQSWAEFELSFTPGQNRTGLSLQLNSSANVELWWPNGHGRQPRYHLLITTSLQSGVTLHTDTLVSFRTVELVEEPIPSSPGLSFYFRVNGRPIFLKGSNWIPAHSFQDQVTPDLLRSLLQSAVDANMNALRVWGGGVYEQELFYSLCDELGVMVWQDFMFACALYPTEQDFIQTVREEVTQQVRRLKSHPSVIVWSGNNENEAAIATDWFDIPVAERPRYLKDYVKLYVENIRAIVLQEDSSRPFLVSSPTNGAESEREGWVSADPYDPHYGDTHFYSYSKDCWDWSQFPRTRFASEYGFQSWPSLSTLSQVSVAEDWDYSSAFSLHRQHHESGNEQMLQQAALHYTLPNHTDPLLQYTHTLYITQVMQAQCVKAQTEFYRRSRSDIIEGKGHTMGALYWQLNDIWQGPSWSSIEFGGKWKMLQYWAVDFFAPVSPVGFEQDGSLLIYAVSDLHTDLSLTVTVTVYRWTSLVPVCSVLSEVSVVRGGGATLLLRRTVSALLGDCGNCTRSSCFLTFHLREPAGQRGPSSHLFLSSPKLAQGLLRPNITFSVQANGGCYVVTLRCVAVAAFVWLDVGDIAGRFESNGFLLTSPTLSVTFHPWAPTSTSELTRRLRITSLRDLY